MKITKWDEQAAEDIGHAFGYYDYGQETGMGVFYSSKEAVANYIAGYVRMAFEGQMLYATSERGEGYIAYTLPGQKMNLKAGMAILKALFRNMSLKEMIRMGKALSKGGKSLQDRMKKEKKDFIFVGMVCVREQYQGQGYMRKVLTWPSLRETGCTFQSSLRLMPSRSATNTCISAWSLRACAIWALMVRCTI